MRVVVNGDPVVLSDSSTVRGMLEVLGVAPERVAVEVNLEIVPRQDYASWALHEGDRIELITFVGGG